MPHFFNTPHAFKKFGEVQPDEMKFGEMPHTPEKKIMVFSFRGIGFASLSYCIFSVDASG